MAVRVVWVVPLMQFMPHARLMQVVVAG